MRLDCICVINEILIDLQQIKLPSSPGVPKDISGRYTPNQQITPPASSAQNQQYAHNLTTSRPSPMGQSSSTGGQGSYSSQQSANSTLNLDTTNQNVSFQTFGKFSPNQSDDYSPTLFPSIALGPSSKYPETSVLSQSRPSSAKSRPPSVPPKPENTTARELTNPYQGRHLAESPNKTGLNQSKASVASSQFGGINSSYMNKSDNQLDIDPGSIFDYISHSEPSSRSVTPPLPPLSNSNSDTEISSFNFSPKLPRKSNGNFYNTPKTPDLLTNMRNITSDKRSRRVSGGQLNTKKDKRSRNQASAIKGLNLMNNIHLKCKIFI